MKLDIGTRKSNLEGFTAVDWSGALDARSLPYASNSIDAIQASHVLEHVATHEMLPMFTHWIDILKPGAAIRIAVPDFDAIVKVMQSGEHPTAPVEGWIMGGQTDSNDYHHSIWTKGKLTLLMETAGLIDIIPWVGVPGDCSSVMISLNLQGTKPIKDEMMAKPPSMPDMKFVMTMPRLSWTDTMLCLAGVAHKLDMDIVKTSGVFYGQCMQRALEDMSRDPKLKYAVTVDYDTMFDWRDLVRMRDIADRYELDALAPLQSGRERTTPLFTVSKEQGATSSGLPYDFIDKDWFQCSSVHFGLTLIRLESLRKLPKPWFASTPDDQGGWGEGRTDDDIHFWKRASAANWQFGVCPSVTVGHIETVCAWVNERMQVTYQPLFQYLRDGKPWSVRNRERWRYMPDERA